MRMKIFYGDLSEEAKHRIQWALSEDLKDEIENAARNGMNKADVENEIIGDHINRHDAGFVYKL